MIALAAVYWMALWLMGRHEDVLYGSFVSSGPAGDEPPEPIRPILPPELPRRPRAALPALPAPSVTSVSRPEQVRPPAPEPRNGNGHSNGFVNGSGAIKAPQLASVSTAQPPATSSPIVPAAARPMPPGLPPKPPLAINPAALQRHNIAPAAAALTPTTQEPSTGDVLASLLETLKRDLNEAARK
ncbi:MAG: hypothetical protein HZA66_19365 [Rhodopseudomonas palustris]|uniref:Uncharacterized protein n=1 Tax=Rhodopseudomonas palustris TaxID=1076 RepID=A0A933VX15_RHOPL|nr:hypothetical protein [Rhodopseudomonas palustris]